MRKTDKKTENQLRIALTDVCEIALEEFTGFQWLTHLVNYADFPKSLQVVCIFDTNDNLNSFTAACSHQSLNTLIQRRLLEMGLNINNINNHVSYDTEENRDKHDNGKWADRLRTHAA